MYEMLIIATPIMKLHLMTLVTYDNHFFSMHSFVNSPSEFTYRWIGVLVEPYVAVGGGKGGGEVPPQV